MSHRYILYSFRLVLFLVIEGGPGNKILVKINDYLIFLNNFSLIQNLAEEQ